MYTEYAQRIGFSQTIQYLVLTKPTNHCLKSSRTNLALIGWQGVVFCENEARKNGGKPPLTLRSLRLFNLILAVCDC